MAEQALPDVPVFSDGLSALLEALFKGEAPNSGRFCGYCYTPVDKERAECPHCERSVEPGRVVQHVPDEVVGMFRQLRRRESLVVNSFAYLGLFLGVMTFVAIFYVLFTTGANFWWYVFDIVLLFVLARVLAGILGGYVGDELGFRYARRKLVEDWGEYEAEQRPAANGGKAPSPR